jgi:3-hydroxyacyl-CoA dehydrogenase
MIGCGSMGGGMALLFAEIGVHVSLSDPSEEAMDAVMRKAEKQGYHGKVDKYTGSPTRPTPPRLKINKCRLRLALQVTVITTPAYLLSSTWRRW